MTHAFRMPAEWEKQASILLAWPHNKNDWPGKFAPIPWVYAEIVRLIAQHQKVRLLVKNVEAHHAAKDILERAHTDMANVEFHIIPTNRVWLRDSGPIFVYEGKKKVALDWRFTAWAKYPNHALDNKVPELLNNKLKLKRVQPMHKGKRVVLEGGAIDVSGKGVLLTTEECLLDPKVQVRNPGFTREDYEEVFEKYLGISQTIWLGNGVAGDDTHGHVDDLARFVDETTVVTVVEKDKRSANYAPLQDNLKRLKRARDAKGKPLNVIELPMPKPLYFEETFLPASYANFLITNKTVLVPVFNDANDRTVLNTLQECFPTREIIGIQSVDLVWGFGTLHCMSQQEPL